MYTQRAWNYIGGCFVSNSFLTFYENKSDNSSFLLDQLENMGNLLRYRTSTLFTRFQGPILESACGGRWKFFKAIMTPNYQGLRCRTFCGDFGVYGEVRCQCCGNLRRCTATLFGRPLRFSTGRYRSFHRHYRLSQRISR